MSIEENECPKHGQNGNPNCSICWEKLYDLLSKENVYVTGDDVNDY